MAGSRPRSRLCIDYAGRDGGNWNAWLTNRLVGRDRLSYPGDADGA